ncbi:hypothetical protein PG102015_0154 [Bifidobacterium pseudolongum subsp. globosum]|uniref:helix-turn-helix domain-containing protein n=1 Tax=Bifidobacterium pseudolongum TaxID=1694 RepID=UPI0010218454|nr:helix-turn-helix transcriptional regulator [Bifidobacterium pseudolongum]RYP97897.1 hypothetical protein PG102015_0154 [Bifidobacterium pseudolongum subsp. globosum]
MIDINESKRIWDERLVRRYKELGYTQQSLAQALDELHPERGVNQTMVSRWCHLHDTDRSFPKYETMREIADLLDTTVAWLTGQIDSNDWDQERAAAFLGLDAEAMAGLYTALHPEEHTDENTVGQSSVEFGRTMGDTAMMREAAFNLLFTSPQFQGRFAHDMAVYFHAFFMRGEISASWHSENAPFELMEYTLEQQCYVARMKAQNSFVALMDELDKQMDLQEDDPSGNADQMDETTEAKLFDGELIQAFEEFTKRFDLK